MRAWWQYCSYQQWNIFVNNLIIWQITGIINFWARALFVFIALLVNAGVRAHGKLILIRKKTIKRNEPFWPLCNNDADVLIFLNCNLGTCTTTCSSSSTPVCIEGYCFTQGKCQTMIIFYYYNPIYLNSKLHNFIWQTTLGLSRSHFDGVCLDGSSSSTTISSSTNAVDTDAGTDVACNSKCNADSSCTAFAFLYLPQTCILYSGGPYTSGDGASAKRCFLRETGNTIYAVNPALKK